MKIKNLFLMALAALTINAHAVETIVRADQTPGVATQKDYMISNGHFENNVGNWLAYADAAGISPVDGVGGSPVLTCTRTTSSPLSGRGSFLITKGATNRQGDGCGSTFTIDSTDQARVLEVSFDYAIPSGTFTAGSSSTDSDLEFFIYDRTNAVLIPLTTQKVFSNSSSPSASYSGYFQSSSNSTSYRLIAHVATTNASAWTFKADNFKIQRSKYIYGTPITDWVSFTPTGSWVSGTSTYSGYWRRVGSDVEVMGKILQSGAPTTAGLTINLPTGLVIDTTKISFISSAALGFGYINDSGVTTYDAALVYNTTTSVTVLIKSRPSVYVEEPTAVTQALPMTWGNLDFVTYYYKAPIVGWSSSVQMSDTASPAVIAARISFLNGVTTTTTGGVIKYFTTEYDTTGSYSASTGLYTCPVSGYYRVTNYANNSSAQNAAAFTYLGVNGNSVNARLVTALLASAGSGGSATVQCNAGSTLGIYSSVNTLAFNDGAAFNYVMFEKISGPVSIGATETISARYVNTAGTSIANSGDVKMVFATKDYDDHSGFLTDTYTIPAAGKYHVHCGAAYTSSTYAAANFVYVAVYKNGAAYQYGTIQLIGGAVTGGVGVSVDAQPNLIAGDTIDCRTENNRTAGATALSTVTGENYFEILRVGL
ncbi:MAG: hypothetical protein ACXWQE_00030 [Bdellovibrionales bacterium]